jgi:hypothetical protein
MPAKTSLILSGKGMTASFGGNAITNINNVVLVPAGERPVIDLSTADDTTYVTRVVAGLIDLKEVTLNVKFAGATHTNFSLANNELTITLPKVDGGAAFSWKAWCQLKSIDGLDGVDKAPANGTNVAMNFTVTNLNTAFVETGPTIS